MCTYLKSIFIYNYFRQQVKKDKRHGQIRHHHRAAGAGRGTYP